MGVVLEPAATTLGRWGGPAGAGSVVFYRSDEGFNHLDIATMAGTLGAGNAPGVVWSGNNISPGASFFLSTSAGQAYRGAATTTRF